MAWDEKAWRREWARQYRLKYPEVCREYNRRSTNKRRTLQKEHMLDLKQKSYKKRTDLYEDLKNVPCQDCKRLYPTCVMEFDHVRGTKFKAVSQLRAAKLEVFLAEVEKCDMVCSNCHRISTHKKDMMEAHLKIINAGVDTSLDMTPEEMQIMFGD